MLTVKLDGIDPPSPLEMILEGSRVLQTNMGMSENTSAKGTLWKLANEDVQHADPKMTLILCVFTISIMRTGQCSALLLVIKSWPSCCLPPSPRLGPQVWKVSVKQVLLLQFRVSVCSRHNNGQRLDTGRKGKNFQIHIWAERYSVNSALSLQKPLWPRIWFFSTLCNYNAVIKYTFPGCNVHQGRNVLMQSNYQQSNASLQVIGGSKVIVGSCGGREKASRKWQLCC